MMPSLFLAGSCNQSLVYLSNNKRSIIPKAIRSLNHIWDLRLCAGCLGVCMYTIDNENEYEFFKSFIKRYNIYNNRRWRCRWCSWDHHHRACRTWFISVIHLLMLGGDRATWNGRGLVGTATTPALVTFGLFLVEPREAANRRTLHEGCAAGGFWYVGVAPHSVVTLLANDSTWSKLVTAEGPSWSYASFLKFCKDANACLL